LLHFTNEFKFTPERSVTHSLVKRGGRHSVRTVIFGRHVLYILHPPKGTRKHQTAKSTAVCRPEWHNFLPLSNRWTGVCWKAADRLVRVSVTKCSSLHFPVNFSTANHKQIISKQSCRFSCHDGRSTASFFLNLGARWRSVVNFTPRPLYPGEKSGNSFNRRVGGFQG